VAYLTAGEVGLRSGGPDAARPDFEKCLTLRKELVDADKKSILAQRDLAAILGRMGDTELQWRRRPYEALVFYRQAHPLHESLHKVDPKNVENRKDLSQSHYRLGTAALWSGDRTAADAHFQACRKLREAMANDDPKNLYKKLEYLLVQARCGQHAEVASAADTMATDDPGLLYFIGCSYALCVSAVAPGKAAGELTTGEQELKKRYTAKAVQAIGRAIDKGFKDREALQLDPDLEPIQKDAEYAKLLGRLKKG
jgi:hypothetical protein